MRRGGNITEIFDFSLFLIFFTYSVILNWQKCVHEKRTDVDD